MLTTRDKMSGLWHAVDFLVALIGMAGWIYMATHLPKNHVANVEDDG